MLEILKEIDVQILFFINSLHHPIMDEIMIFFTKRFTWIPFYAFLVFLIIRKEKFNSWLPLVFITLIIIMADQFASGLMKPLTERLRPCHNASLQDMLHLPYGCGGRYGFFSSHAANTFAVAAFLTGFFRKKVFYLMFVWAAAVSLSRVYLGVHYPSDITAGALSGTLIGYIMVMLYFYCKNKLQKQSVIKAY
ncbi:phosphatase PAP2 family protein [Cytophagaceae bacterium ABcell3]|nr:phosphatase PAP2 family protein [Cytophagaceae bacterium ABcell3]